MCSCTSQIVRYSTRPLHSSCLRPQTSAILGRGFFGRPKFLQQSSKYFWSIVCVILGVQDSRCDPTSARICCNESTMSMKSPGIHDALRTHRNLMKFVLIRSDSTNIFRASSLEVSFRPAQFTAFSSLEEFLQTSACTCAHQAV